MYIIDMSKVEPGLSMNQTDVQRRVHVYIPPRMGVLWWVCGRGEHAKNRPRTGRVGMKTKLNKETTRLLIEGFELGMTNKLAAQYAGITEACFYMWRKKADAGSRRHVVLFESLKRAEAKHAAHALAVIRRAANEGTWSAAAWLLERRHAFRRDAPPVQQAATMEVKETETIDPTTKEGREAIVSTISELPEEMILAALNRRSSTALAK